MSVRLTFIQIPETLNGLLKYLDMLDKTTHQLRIINGYWVVFDNVIYYLIASVVSQGHFRISDDWSILGTLRHGWRDHWVD